MSSPNADPPEVGTQAELKEALDRVVKAVGDHYNPKFPLEDLIRAVADLVGRFEYELGLETCALWPHVEDGMESMAHTTCKPWPEPRDGIPINIKYAKLSLLAQIDLKPQLPREIWGVVLAHLLGQVCSLAGYDLYEDHLRAFRGLVGAGYLAAEGATKRDTE
jgi:hypothetical protein